MSEPTYQPLSDADDFGLDTFDPDWKHDSATICRVLRGFSCPAGEPHTGSEPEADHGHMACYYHYLAIARIEELEAEVERLRQGYVPHFPQSIFVKGPMLDD